MSRPFNIAQDMVDRRKPSPQPCFHWRWVGVILLTEALIGAAGLWVWRMFRCWQKSLVGEP